MQLMNSQKATAVELLPDLSQEFRDCSAANDTYEWVGKHPALRDLNALLREITNRVAKMVRPGILDVEFNLDPNLKDVLTAPDLLAFVVGGVLSSQLRALDATERGLVRVTTIACERATTIRLMTNSLPDLETVRAISDSVSIARAKGCDPVVLHCRQIVEEFGGTITLSDEGKLLGLEVYIPKLPHCSPAGLGRPIALSFFEVDEHALCMAS